MNIAQEFRLRLYKDVIVNCVSSKVRPCEYHIILFGVMTAIMVMCFNCSFMFQYFIVWIHPSLSVCFRKDMLFNWNTCFTWKYTFFLLLKEVALDMVELAYKEQYFSRADMWRLRQHLVREGRLRKFCLFINSSPQDKMAAILQTIFWDAFSWMKSFVFWLKFHWSLFLRVQLTIIQHWFR